MSSVGREQVIFGGSIVWSEDVVATACQWALATMEKSVNRTEASSSPRDIGKSPLEGWYTNVKYPKRFPQYTVLLWGQSVKSWTRARLGQASTVNWLIPNGVLDVTWLLKPFSIVLSPLMSHRDAVELSTDWLTDWPTNHGGLVRIVLAFECVIASSILTRWGRCVALRRRTPFYTEYCVGRQHFHVLGGGSSLPIGKQRKWQKLTQTDKSNAPLVDCKV